MNNMNLNEKLLDAEENLYKLLVIIPINTQYSNGRSMTEDEWDLYDTLREVLKK